MLLLHLPDIFMNRCIQVNNVKNRFLHAGSVPAYIWHKPGMRKIGRNGEQNERRFTYK